MILNGNKKTTALVGGICALRDDSGDYDEVCATIIYEEGKITDIRKTPSASKEDLDKHADKLREEFQNNILIVRLDNDNEEESCHVFPGLVDIHNHIDYNMMPIWERPNDEPWDNRHEWRNCNQYTKDIKDLYNYIFVNWPKDDNKNQDVYTVIQFFSELQAIAGGTTTLQESTGISYPIDEKDDKGKYKKVFRNMEHILLRSTGISEDIGLDSNQRINSVIDFYKPELEKGKDYNPPLDTSEWVMDEVMNGEKSYVSKYLELLDRSEEEIQNSTGGYLVHLAEGRAGNLLKARGVDAYSKKEFETLKEQINTKIRGLGEEGTRKVNATRMTLIHGCGMDLESTENIEFVNDCGIRVVWSPVSNLLLYDDTPAYLLSDIKPDLICIGSDWAPSGSKHVWDEARFAQEFALKYFYNENNALDNINNTFLDMISYNPAKAIGSDKLGAISVGNFADFYIVSKNRKIPQQYMAVNRISDVFKTFSDYESVGTIINGNLIFGVKELFEAFGMGDNPKVVSIEADMYDSDGKKIEADETAERLRVYIPDVEIDRGDESYIVNIDFNSAIETLDRLFKEFTHEYNLKEGNEKKAFIRSKLLSSYDLPYQEQINKLKEKFELI